MTKRILLAAGGTGGHLFPAEALAHELARRGHEVHLATDERAGRFSGSFPATETHVVPSATFGSRNPVAVARALLKLWTGLRTASALLRRLKPDVTVGFGGYPSVPPVLAATQAGWPSMIHEQNAVMGRANRFLARRVGRIAAGIPQDKAPQELRNKIVVTGNPVRPSVLEAAKKPYRPSGSGEEFNLVVFGGSQGASFFSQVLPEAIALLDPTLRARLRVTQQARSDDEERVRTYYADAAIPAEVSPFFADMADRLAAAHLVISRSGASTVSELAVIGRPSILVPYPYALDHDQAANAARLEAQGGTIVARQADLTAERLAAILTRLADEPGEAARMADAARATGIPNAAELLADLVEAMPPRTARS